MKKMISRFNNRFQNFKTNFKTKFQEYKKKPKSKRKSFILGFACVLATFSVALAVPTLSAVAKDTPNVCPNPTDIVPAPPAHPIQAVPPSSEIINASLSGLAASVCSLAITSGSFAIGVACGCIVVIGILHLQSGKK